MSHQQLFRRGTSAQLSSYTPGTTEIVADTTSICLRIGDSSQAGGYPLHKFASTVTTLTQYAIIYSATTTTLNNLSGDGVLKLSTTGIPSVMTGGTNRVTFWSDANTLSSNANATCDGSYFAIGPNPATSGPFRMPNNTWLTIRNAANNGNIELIGTSTDNNIYVGLDTAGVNVLMRAGSSAGTNFYSGGVLTWSFLSTGILQSNGAQTIQSSSGVLTVTGTGGLGLTTAANTNITMTPNGSGVVNINTATTSLISTSNVVLTWNKSGAITFSATASSSVLAFTSGSGAGTYSFDNTIAGTNLTLSAMTQKSVLFAGASGAVSQDNANFQYDSTNVCLAIGAATSSDRSAYVVRSGAVATSNYGQFIYNNTTSSTASINKYGLAVASDGNWTGTSAVNYAIYISSCANGTTNWAIYNNTAANVYLGTGNVGIGTTGPGSTLSVQATAVNGATTTVSRFFNPGSGAGTGATIGLGYGDTDVTTAGISGFYDSATAGISLSFSTIADAGVSSRVERMRILGTGNVGIGTTSPSTLLHVGLAGTTLGTIGIAGNTSGLVTLTVAAAAGTWTMKLPTGVAGTAGFQLTDAGGDGITSWASAASTKVAKNIIGQFKNTKDALNKILSASVYNFKYKEGMGTGDLNTEYVGIMAEESPWAMHFNNKILNPVSTFGYTVLAIQELNKEIQNLKKQIKELKK